MKVTITIEDSSEGVELNCEFSEAVTDDTQSTAAWLAVKLMEHAGSLSKGGN